MFLVIIPPWNDIAGFYFALGWWDSLISAHISSYAFPSGCWWGISCGQKDSEREWPHCPPLEWLSWPLTSRRLLPLPAHLTSSLSLSLSLSPCLFCFLRLIFTLSHCLSLSPSLSVFLNSLSHSHSPSVSPFSLPLCLLFSLHLILSLFPSLSLTYVTLCAFLRAIKWNYQRQNHWHWQSVALDCHRSSCDSMVADLHPMLLTFGTCRSTRPWAQQRGSVVSAPK